MYARQRAADPPKDQARAALPGKLGAEMLKDLTTVQKAVLASLTAIVVLSAGAVAFSRGRALPPQEPLPASASPASGGTLTVHISGAVAHPGVYTLPRGDRLAQAIEAAGGLAPDAEASGLNLARPLREGERLRVPPRKAAPAPATVRAASPPKPPRPPRPAAGPAPTAPAPVSLNTADAAQLARLPGLSRTLADRVVAYRTTHGHFRRVEELLLVQGMTPKILEQVRPYLTL